MKKYLILLIVLAFLFTAGIFAVSAETQADAVWCDRCGKNIPASEWMEWTATGGDVNKEGHYYLADTFTAQESTINIPALKFICLDLRGNTWITEGIRPFVVEGDLSILDTVGGGKILTTGGHLLDGGFASVTNVGALNIYGGTIQRIVREDITLFHGGLLDIQGGAVNIYGGTLSGGVVQGIVVSGTTKTPRGGNIYMAGGTLSVYGGTITNGMNIAGASSNPQGGNIYATKNDSGKAARITITGGTVTGGYSDWDGGNIFIGSATLILSDNGVISGGHAVRNGGNIGITGEDAVVTLSGGSLSGGVAGGCLNSSTTSQGYGGGGNIYGYKGTLNISDITIDGNIRLDSTMTAVNLSGVTKINLGTVSGLLLANAMDVDAGGLTDGSEIFVRTGGGAFTKEISADQLERIAGYFKGAVRTELSVDTEANTVNATQGTTGYCPHCYDPANPQTVTWTAASSSEFSTSGHYYLSGSKIGTGNYAFYTDCVLDLNGYTIQRTGARVILAGSNVALDVLDSVGGGRIIGTGTNATYGAIQLGYSGCKLTLHSGNLIFASGDATVTVPAGGLIYAATANCKINIKGGVISGGSLKSESPTGGGNIYISNDGSTLNISAGIIKKGNSGAANGGNIYAAGKVTVSGGVILDGQANSGGNIYTTKEVEMTGGIIWNGSSGSNGNIYTKKLNVSGGVIAYGKSTGNGGNIRLGDATSTISGNAVIHSGRAGGNAGNLYCVQAMTLNIEGGLIAGGSAVQGGNIRQNAGNCTVNVTGGMIAMGQASGNGGNLYINNGTFEMTGGAVTAGTAAAGGNIYFNNNVYGIFMDDRDTATALPVVSYGTATGGNGGNIVFMATGNSSSLTYKMQLGSCMIYGGTASASGDNIYVNETAVFEVLPDFAQNTTIYFHSNLIQDEIYLKNDHVFCEGLYSGELLFENRTNLPKIVTTQADPTLVIGQAALVMNNGSVLWFGSNAEAVAAYNRETAYIQPGNGEVVLPAGVYVIDLAGQNVTLTGEEAQVYCFDSANVTFGACGTATLAGPALMNTLDYNADGAVYITVADTQENTYSFHYLDMRVSSISIRPGSAGVYYSCTWNCDEVLKPQLKNVGVAVSMVNMPGADFATDADTFYTQLSASELEMGKAYNSVLINNIFSDAADNNDVRGATPVFATPYVTLQNGESVVRSDEFKHSLKTALQLIDTNDYYANKSMLESFYQTWQSAMENWDFVNIGVKPQDDDTLRILMVGNSFCSYYTDELYHLLVRNLPEGVEKVEVYNLYASGRTITAHYNRWNNKSEGDYYLYRRVGDDRVSLSPNGGWTLEEALAVANWDYISLQGKTSSGSYVNGEDGCDAMIAEMEPMVEALLGRFHEMFPYTQLLWHRTWNQEVGRVTDSGFVYTEEYNALYDPGMQYVCDYMTEVFDQDKPYDLIQVNSGAAWTEARRLNAALIEEGGEEAGLLPYGGLCAGNGRNTFGDGRANSGDGQHDGDIGGGQLLNAYMWYMTITGDTDLSEVKDFKPVYVYDSTEYPLSDAFVEMLQTAAITTYAAYNP